MVSFSLFRASAPKRQAGSPGAFANFQPESHEWAAQMLYEHVDTAVIDGELLPWVPFTPMQ